MIKYRQTLIVLLLMVLSGEAVAQNNTNSPYTRYGYGQLADQGSSNSKAMGGVAYALRDKYQINFANPASYTAVDSLTFIFDGGVSLQNTNLSNGTLKQNAKNSSFDYITMQFRASRWAAISIGLLPYANVGYNMGEYETIENSTESYSKQYSGEGGLHQLYVGAGFKIFKNFSIGANISYLWGDVTRTTSESFPSSTTNFPFTIQTNVGIRSYKLDFGAQYTQTFGKKHSMTLGVVYSPGHNLNNSAYELRVTGNSSSATSSQKDIVADFGIPTHRQGVQRKNRLYIYFITYVFGGIRTNFSKRTLLSFIQAGVFDGIEPNRAKLAANIDNAIALSESESSDERF